MAAIQTSTGLATGMSPGTSTISASLGGVSGTAALTVNAPTSLVAAGIAARGAQSCALLAGGSVACWGLSNTYSATPALVSGISGATAIAATASGACALLPGGTVDCWGWNGVSYDTSPVTVTGISGATAIAAGGYQTCALLTGGTVDCWGDNTYGELGDGTFTSRPTAVAVTGISGATGIAGGGFHTCALLTGGTVDCWGDNTYGELGDGSFNGSPTPVAVTGISGATAITAGGNAGAGYGGHTCVLLAGGTVDCWGLQLANGTATTSATPVAVTGISGATAIAGGGFHTCALVAGGSLDCWGDNTYDQLGDGGTTSTPSPVAVGGISGATAIAAGDFHTCALLAGGNVDCWGQGLHGQLGNGGTASYSGPVEVTGLIEPATATPTGPSVAVTPVSSSDGTTPVTVTFGDVTASGYTSLTTSTTAPSIPSGFAIGSPPVYYDLSTTAAYTTPITVCISYAGITPAPTTMLHYNSVTSTWDNVWISTDTVNQIICGQPPSLSPFALVHATLSSTTTTVSSSANPSLLNQAITFTADVTSSGGTPSGTVQFTVDGAKVGSGVALSGGTATASISTLGVGNHVIKAVYGGSSTFSGSTGSLTQAVTYRIGVLSNQAKASKAGSGIPLKVQLLDDGDVNVSSPGITLTVGPVAPSPSPGAAPTGTFTFEATGDSGPMYQYDLKTTDYPPGTYTVSFAVTGDPVDHALSFVIR